MAFSGLLRGETTSEEGPDHDSRSPSLRGVNHDFDLNDQTWQGWDFEALPEPACTIDGWTPPEKVQHLVPTAATEGSGNSSNNPSNFPISKTTSRRKPCNRKDRVSEVEQKVDCLQQVVEDAQLRRHELLAQERKLQSSAKFPNNSGEAGPGLDGLPDPNNLYWVLDTGGVRQHWKGTYIINLTNEQSLAIHQIYMDVLRRMLARRRDARADAEIGKVAHEACRATFLKAVYKPASMRGIINFDGQNLNAEGKKQVAKQALAALNLSGGQREQMLQQRRSHLATQGQLLQNRQQLLARLQETQTRPCSSELETVKQASICQKLMSDLQQNLRADQNLLIRLFCQIFGNVRPLLKDAFSYVYSGRGIQILLGIQPAIILTEFWPNPFDLVALLNELALQAGDVETQTLLGPT
ncbi:hypothetical protein WJX74_007874 [Apatococcus lobatus]|uniref:Uncharacterized protein n=1 Tax=Apatococcus lobatus TaxID=904363 RepID=A0AAW1RG97_9CHLO